jgi:thiol:disulfide interchange protein DsbD
MLGLMLRVLLLAGLAMTVARASDKIDASVAGASALVTQPHVTAELIPEMTTVETGKPFGMILHLHMDAGWHTYWINPGDAGLATTIKWTLPPGFTAGPIQWPVPEKHAMGPLMTYGYDGDVYLLTTITPPDKGDLPQHFDVKAKAEWLVCQEECIPGKAELTVTLDSGLMNFRLPEENTELFKEARGRLPVAATGWKVEASYGAGDLALLFHLPAGEEMAVPKNARFYPEQANVLSTLDKDNSPAQDAGKPGSDDKTEMFRIKIALQQNGDKPPRLSGVLVSNQPLIGDAKAVQISEFAVAAAVPAAGAGNPASATNGGTPQPSPSQANATEPAAGTAAATQNAAPSAGANATEPAAGTAAATNGNATPSASPRTGGSPSLQGAQPLLIAVLGAAFIGGLILNLMPCVLPVLSLKVFALIRHAGDNPKAAWRQGAAFTAGVVVSFWVLAGLLLALRAAGDHLGWGFQMQSPGFVAALIVLFFLIGLNLFGVFEIGGSLVGLDAKAASHAGGSVSSLLNGALATLAATPCTAPFMGSALGFAAEQPAAVSLLIFTFLALGMATPYLLLTIFPQSLRFVPKPGAWMESLKQFMGFLLMGTVIFLLYVFGALKGNDQILSMLFVLLLVSFTAWIYARWVTPSQSTGYRLMGIVMVTLLSVGIVVLTIADAEAHEGSIAAERADQLQDGYWQAWSPESVQAALAQGKPVFVDFTAAWCLSCKVNERVALGTDEVKKAFADRKVALFRADWTHSDPRISETLEKFNRDGVPLYLLYSPKAPDAPQVLPEVLTPGIVLEALGKI